MPDDQTDFRVTTRLFNRLGGYVTTVIVPPFNPPAEIIQWGSRLFIRRLDGSYREGLLWFAIEDHPEPAREA